LVVVTVALAVIVTSAFVFLLAAMARVNRARDIAVNSADEAYAARNVRRVLGDMETGERGFLITGEESVLRPWDSGRQRISEYLTTLRTLVDDPEQAQCAEHLERDARSYVNEYSIPIVEAARRGEPWVRSLATSEEGMRFDAFSTTRPAREANRSACSARHRAAVRWWRPRCRRVDLSARRGS
jgi:CHASE3 domain sensor protein